MACGASKQGIDACEQFFVMEGLGEIVIGTCFKAFHLVLPTVACSQNENGEFSFQLAQLADQLHPADTGQAKINDTQVERILTPEKQAVFPVFRGVHRVTALLELRLQGFTQCGFIFDQENAHAT